jgi:multidrug resistance efflux pump
MDCTSDITNEEWMDQREFEDMVEQMDQESYCQNMNNYELKIEEMEGMLVTIMAKADTQKKKIVQMEYELAVAHRQKILHLGRIDELHNTNRLLQERLDNMESQLREELQEGALQRILVEHVLFSAKEDMSRFGNEI